MEKQIQKKSKSLSWHRLFQKIGKQPLHKTRNTTVQVLIDGAMQDCSLIFTDSGKHFYLKPVVSYRITCNNGNQRTLINP